MALRLIDTNVFLRHFLADDPDKAKAAQALLLRVEAGTERVTTSPLVLFELVFTLHRKYSVPKQDVVSLITGVLDYRGLHLAGKELWRDALHIWVSHSIDFTDAYNVAYMRSLGVSEVYAWDRGYDHVSRIHRLEPTGGLSEDSEQEVAA